MKFDAAAWIALAALFLSAFTLVRQWRSAGAANFTVDWERSGSIALVNRGPGAARDLHLEPADSPHVASTANANYVGVGQVVRIEVLAAFGAEPIGSVTVRWKDNRLRTQSRVLSVPRAQQHPKRSSGGAVDNAVRLLAEAAAEDVIADYLPPNLG